MDTTYTTIKLIANNDTAKRFIAVMGDTVIRADEVWGEDDIEVTYKFIKEDGVSVGWIGDDSIGACVGACMEDEKMIGIFNFGDDGDYRREINCSTTFVTIGDL